MAKQKMMQKFARWHIWLGWLVGVPILMWTITGLVMVARPIEEVRGSHLRSEPASIAAGSFVFPDLDQPIRSAELVQQLGGPVWVVTGEDGNQWRRSATSGSLLSPVTESEARRTAEATYAGDAAIEELSYFPADAAPLDLRRNRASWRARFGDGTNFYIDDNTGQVLALRTPFWRIFDFAWGLHIMDLKTREDTHHPILVLFAALSVIGALLGTILMFRRRKARAGS